MTNPAAYPLAVCIAAQLAGCVAVWLWVVRPLLIDRDWVNSRAERWCERWRDADAQMATMQAERDAAQATEVEFADLIGRMEEKERSLRNDLADRTAEMQRVTVERDEALARNAEVANEGNVAFADLNARLAQLTASEADARWANETNTAALLAERDAHCATGAECRRLEREMAALRALVADATREAATWRDSAQEAAELCRRQAAEMEVVMGERDRLVEEKRRREAKGPNGRFVGRAVEPDALKAEEAA